MARPQKKGLDYFSLDIDWHCKEDKMYFIKAKHGITGLYIINILWCRIYGTEGYYCNWNEREAIMFTDKHSIDIDVLNDLINDYINEGIFNKNMFDKYHILTSSGTQKRYLKGCERRNRVEINSVYNLLTGEEVKEYKNLVIVDMSKNKSNDNEPSEEINVDENQDNEDINTTKESKVKKIKLNESKEDESKENYFETDNDLSNKWTNILEFIKTKIPPPKYLIWFDCIDTNKLSIQGNEFKISVANKQHEIVLANEYFNILKEAFDIYMPEIETLDISSEEVQT